MNAKGIWNKSLLCIAISVLAALVAGECLLRVVPNPLCTPDPVAYEPDPYVGGWHRPHQVARCRSTCFDTRDIHFNARGMRSRKDYTQDKHTYRIAVLGDSFVEALQVSETEHFCAVLQGLLPHTEVMNFGVSGYGTVQEFVAYLHRVRPFKPDLVVLCFAPGNDVKNNFKPLEERGPAPMLHRPWLLRSGNGYELIYPTYLQPRTSAAYRTHRYCYEHLCIYQTFYNAFFSRITQRLLYHRKPGGRTDTGGKTPDWPVDSRFLDYGVYRAPTDPLWKEAWEITQEAMLRLKHAVEADGAQFTLVILVDALQVEPEPASTMQETYGLTPPADFDVTYPVKHLQEFAARHAIPSLALLDSFLRYRDRFELPPPYFFNCCDGHWNPLGHHIAAHRFWLFLMSNGMIPANALEGDRSALMERTRQEMERSPKEILGEQTHRKIFSNR